MIAKPAQALPVRPWTVKIDGMVEQPREVGVDDLIRAMPLEERLYRHRCVEAWSMAIPWSGFPFAALVNFARPLSSARYVRMETFFDSKVASGQRQTYLPWPYVEGLTMAEATNELAFVAVGAYGKPMPKVHGAPLRIAIPWKYGFKSIKSIVRFTFTDQRPKSFWEALAPSEYGFWANVNPKVPHPRWSQETEELIGSFLLLKNADAKRRLRAGGKIKNPNKKNAGREARRSRVGAKPTITFQRGTAGCTPVCHLGGIADRVAYSAVELCGAARPPATRQPACQPCEVRKPLRRVPISANRRAPGLLADGTFLRSPAIRACAKRLKS